MFEMKKLITLLLLAPLAMISVAQNNVTFQVDMNQYTGSFTTPEVNGDFNGWCGNCNVMSDSNSDGIWEVTLPLTADSIEFKYSHDSWAGQESLTPGSACTKTTSGFTNRFIHINADTTLPVVCWESCIACGTPPDTSNITFRVDMSQYTGTFTTPEVNGTFNGWCGNCNAMTDADGDNIWEVTLPLTDDSIEYKFSYDSWTGEESLTEGDACTKTSGGFTNRFLVLNGDQILDPVCWESCMACVVPVDSADVTFRVDMNEYTTAFTTPEVNGTFNGWCGNCNAMDDSDGDGIWEVTLKLPEDSLEYKFSHDNWTGQEELTEGDTCTLTTGQFTNRLVVVTGDTTLPAVCWESCYECEVDTTDTTIGIGSIPALGDLLVYPNPAQDVLTIDAAAFGSDAINIAVVNTVGQQVFTIRRNNAGIETIDISDLENGFYMISVDSDAGFSTTKFMISR